MRPFRLTALLVALTLVWVGFASSASAFHAAEMAAMPAAHSMAMDEMAAMPDCPSHMPDGMKMDMTKCAVSCFGLATTVGYEPVSAVPHVVVSSVRVLQLQQPLASRISGVPTPPPDLV